MSRGLAEESERATSYEWCSAGLTKAFSVGTQNENSEGRESRETMTEGETGRKVAPHQRKAHVHRVWVGPRNGTRRLETRWFDAIDVGRKGLTNENMVKGKAGTLRI